MHLNKSITILHKYMFSRAYSVDWCWMYMYCISSNRNPPQINTCPVRWHRYSRSSPLWLTATKADKRLMNRRGQLPRSPRDWPCQTPAEASSPCRLRSSRRLWPLSPCWPSSHWLTGRSSLSFHRHYETRYTIYITCAVLLLMFINNEIIIAREIQFR